MEFKPNINDTVSRSSSSTNDTNNNNNNNNTSKPSTSLKSKVPFTLKYQLNIRKNNKSNNNNNSPGPHSGILSDLTFDQDKGQFLWATEGYQQQNLKKRRMTNGNSSPKPYDLKVPRPPNAFIIYHRNKSKELAKFKSAGKCETNERHPSKTVAEMWKEESAEVKLQYQREADLALVEHKKKYPFYKYRPKKKDSKNKSKSQQNGNNPLKKGSTNLLTKNDDNNETNNEDNDSQVPIEHRKQAAMESAFTVFSTSSISEDSGNSSTDNTSTDNYSPPHTPSTPNNVNSNLHWDFTDKQVFDPTSEFPLQLPTQQPCQCTAHCVNNNNNNHNNVTLSSEQWDAVVYNVLESIGLIHPHSIPTTAPTPLTPMESNIIPQVFTPTCTLEERNFFQEPEWTPSMNDDVTTNYVVPSQPTSVPPPTPTSPTEYLPWATHCQSIDSQFTAANPITNITNVISTSEHLSQINQQTNEILFTTTANNSDSCGLFDGTNFNFTL